VVATGASGSAPIGGVTIGGGVRSDAVASATSAGAGAAAAFAGLFAATSDACGPAGVVAGAAAASVGEGTSICVSSAVWAGFGALVAVVAVIGFFAGLGLGFADARAALLVDSDTLSAAALAVVFFSAFPVLVLLALLMAPVAFAAFVVFAAFAAFVASAPLAALAPSPLPAVLSVPDASPPPVSFAGRALPAPSGAPDVARGCSSGVAG
jgi:hypothetical protein